MSKKKQPSPLRVTAPRKPVEPAGEGALMTTRIDPPHEIAAAEPAAPRAAPILAATAEVSPRAAAVASPMQQAVQAAPFAVPLAQSFDQMQSQAAQLAAQLCKQQATLDHREAEVNARAAAVESQVRTARLWLVEKLEELAQRTAELNSAAAADAPPTAASHVPPSAEPRGQALPSDPGDARAGDDDSSDSPATALSGTLRFWKQLHWQEEFERWRSAREAAPEHSVAATEHRAAQESPPRSSAANDAAERLRAAEQQLALRSAELEAERRELVAERDALDAERETFIAERQADLHRLAEQRRTMSEKLWRQRARLRRRREAFDAREMALRQLRAEMLRAQQQTLELRLGAEEMWARLHAKAPATDFGAARAELRSLAADPRREGAA